MNILKSKIKYAAFTTDDFLQDDDFIDSVVQPTAESKMYWKQCFEEECMDGEAYRMARNFIHSMQIQSETLSEQEKQDIWKLITASNLQTLQKRNSRYHHQIVWLLLGIAASLIIVAVWNFLPNEKLIRQSDSLVAIETITAPEMPVTDIQLVIDSDKMLSVAGKEADVVYNDQKVMVEDKTGGVQSEELKTAGRPTFNQLIVPYGKRSTLSLSDGSKIWINAGSRVVYPSSFSKDKREIYVDGEIFATIAHNENWPFIVKTKTLSVEVLGTSFDINAYEKDNLKTVVLVSGSLRVNMQNGNTTLIPNQMLSHNSDNAFQVSNVNPMEYITWKDGVLYYKSENLGVILDQLSRYYGKTIICSPQVETLKCSGRLSLIDDLQTILSCIGQTAPIIYRFENDKYEITHL